MTPVMQTAFSMLVIVISYAVMLAASTVAFIVVEHGSFKEGFKNMLKSQKVLDEVGYGISEEALEAIRSIDRLEKRIAELEAQLEPKPETKPVPVKREVKVHEEASEGPDEQQDREVHGQFGED